MLKQGAKIRKRNELPYSSRIIFFIPPYVTDLSIYSYYYSHFTWCHGRVYLWISLRWRNLLLLDYYS